MRKRAVLFLILFLIGGGVLCWGDSPPGASQNFLAAGSAYNRGDYSAAIKEYEEILQGWFESGPLYFNLANSYYKQGELGKAILNYERARRLLPRDGDVNFNYRYALSQVRDGQEEKSLNFLQRFLEIQRRFYSVDEMVKILTILFILWGTVHILSLYLKWTIRLRRLIITVLGTLFLMYTIGLVYKIQKETNLAISLNESEVKFEPRLEATTYFKLPIGEQIKILNREEKWMKIRRNDGKMGWVETKMLEKI